MTNPDPTTPTGNPPAFEPSSEDQVDIADRVQKDLDKANEHERAQTPESSGKATEFDGNPNVDTDDDGGVFSPRDDTPQVIPTKDN
ncbi:MULTISPECIES: hypothetical protein [unclassified Achromobacter]|uniref:hypothetical protein n=1 Tax=unclassified Achromobacter TaxID=2626865 RepID=UPI0011788AD9|nr:MULTISPECIES: hypothetical protein [unclassified Achromobacter]